jgi:hypothetical protein
MGGFVDGEDHLAVHVFEVRPEGVQRDIMLVVSFDHFLDVVERFVPPTALMVAEAPKGRDVPSSNELMVLLQEGLRVVLPQDDQEVDGPSNGVILENIRLFHRLHQKPIRILEVRQMVVLAFPFPRQVQWMVAVGLLADTRSALINLPRLISIPNGPLSIRHVKSLLESFP